MVKSDQWILLGEQRKCHLLVLVTGSGYWRLNDR